MTGRFKSKKILIPDVPLPTIQTTNQGLVVAGIGVLCAGIMTVAVLFVLFGA
jgi:hypothetical protein